MSETLPPLEKSSSGNQKIAEILFWTVAVLLLFLNLGIGGLRGSEGRWAEVVREMFLTGDFLHPTINFEPYFDKPLFSYWAISAFTAVTGGVVTELLIRLPSAVAGLVSLWATRLIARRFADRNTELWSSWILLTVYSFAFWGRLGEADMLNLAFGTLAAGWYVIKRDKTDLVSYLVFGLLCAVGGQTKGLSSVAVPALAVLIDLVLNRTWKKHLNWKLLVAVLISVGIYLTPFLLAALKKDYSDNGLALVFQENIQRYFNSLDHKQRFYAYFIHLPQLFLPWTPFLLLALICAAARWKRLGPDDRWLLLSIAAIFLIFSLSDSKRVYYILPILPFCAVLTARFLLSETAGRLEKLRDLLLKCYAGAIPVLAVLLLAGAAVFGFGKAKLLPFELPPDVLRLIFASVVLTALILLVVWLIFIRRLEPGRFPGGKTGRNFALSASACAVLLTVFFGVLMPRINEDLRTEKKFFTALRDDLDSGRIRPQHLIFFHHNYTNASFYLRRTGKIPVLDSEKKTDEKTVGRELEAKLKDGLRGEIVLVGQLRYFRNIQSPALRQHVLDRQFRTEPSGPWENAKKNGKKNTVIVLKEQN
ncbi:MAG: glycosyltransferase family 39 protein [Lentisphaeria bacterium]|nr:glycosyltransferase family 39 protein [Lentisphaeria bacterium]